VVPLCAEQLIDKKIAGSALGLGAAENQVYIQVIYTAGGRGHSAEIGLVGSHSNKCIDILAQGMAYQKIQFTRFVSAKTESCHVISLAVNISIQNFGEILQFMNGRRQN
jgi:hypothetical protein